MHHNNPVIVLGGAQLGIPSYGILNTETKLNQEKSISIIEDSYSHGIRHIDTARDYKDSEFIIGKWLNNSHHKMTIITKLSHFNDIEILPDEVYGVVKHSVNTSISYIGRKPDYLLLHNASQYWQYNGKIWSALLDLKNKQYIKSLGASVQTPYELSQIISDKDISLIQMPFNILDWRWKDAIKKIKKEKEKRPLIIHARSVFLQGLLLTNEINLWKKANCVNASDIQYVISRVTHEYQRENIADLCFSYVKSHDWVDGIVIGVQSTKELDNNIDLFQNEKLSFDEIKKINKNMPKLSEETLDPSKWSK